MIIPSLEQIEAEQLRRQGFELSKDFFSFLKSALSVLEPQTTFEFNWHIEEVCKSLQKEAFRINKKQPKKQDLLINIPPRSLKSLITTVCFNAWVWTFAPHIKFLTGSYSTSLAVEHSVLTRRLIESNWYQSRYKHVYKLTTDQNTKSFFENDKGGSRNTTSTGSGVTGKGADIIIIDDPHTTQDASSELALNTAWDWYTKTLYSRLNNQEIGLRVVVMQRLSEIDLSGRILDHNLDYNHICLPATKTENVKPKSLAKNYKRNLLFPKRFSKRFLKEAKKNLGSVAFSGQYEQSPAPSDGELIKVGWLQQRFARDELPENITVNFYSDTAYGKESSDNSATLAYSFYNGILYIWAVNKLKAPFPKFLKEYASWVKAWGYTNASKCYFEPKSSGSDIVQVLKESYINAIEDKPPKDSKITRVSVITPNLEAGKVKFNKDFDWDDFIHECKMFPKGKNDDQVDCLSAVCNLSFNQKKRTMILSVG